MYEKISERSEGLSINFAGLSIILTQCRLALSDHIDELAELVQKHYDVSELGDPAASTEVRSSIVYHA